jgi:hypothetical protein
MTEAVSTASETEGLVHRMTSIRIAAIAMVLALTFGLAGGTAHTKSRTASPTAHVLAAGKARGGPILCC